MPNLNDYRVLDFFMRHVQLEIDLTKKPVQVKAKLTIVPNPNRIEPSTDLALDGQNMKLTSLILDGKPLVERQDYVLKDTSLIIKNVPKDSLFTIESTTLLGENTDLFGLYETEGTILVKAETEGLRRVFFCNDRPDNLATYETTIIANEKDYPVLLSNGEAVATSNNDDGVHSITWVDKLPKPSYLFALVAGKLQYSVTDFTTKSGRKLPIQFYVPPTATNKCELAKDVLKKTMRWEEIVFGLECDLKQQMVAGVDKYASGASEPTGLILFNTENLYASEATKTDLGMLRVIAVVAHEFLHYWSGNRITNRDWFNLAYKEGLTTFRAQRFRESLFGTDTVRLLDGKNLDPRAPRQSSYTAVRSLYTAAAYEKSSDIFRMMMITIGEAQFYKSLTHFFKCYDGNAVTLEQLLDSITASSGKDMRPFLNWFTEDGIPSVTVTDEYFPELKRYTLKVKTKDAKSRPIPLVMGLIDPSGKEVKSDSLLMINDSEMEFHFDGLSERPIPSLLRSFSAPVYLYYDYSIHNLITLIQYDTNTYNRCEAMKQLIAKLVCIYCATGRMDGLSELSAALKAVLHDKSLSHWLKAEILTIPSEEELIEGIDKPSFEKIAQARQKIVFELASSLQDEFYKTYSAIKTSTPTKNSQFPEFDFNEAGKRKMLQVCYAYLQTVDPENTKRMLGIEFQDSLGKNMTNTVNALSLLSTMGDKDFDISMDAFYQYWKNDASTINYWLKIQAATHSQNVVDRVRSLLKHPAFDLHNPNKVYALFGPFTNNPYGFHAVNGSGYELVAQCILELDKINPAVAARLTESFLSWDKFDPDRKKFMFDNLCKIYENAISEDVRTIAKKGLDKARSLSPPLPKNLSFLNQAREVKLSKVDMDKMVIQITP